MTPEQPAGCDGGYATPAEDRRRRTGAGEPLIRARLGLTSAAGQRRMGVDRPVVGFLTKSM